MPEVPMDKVYLRVFIAAVKYMNRRLHITSLFMKKYDQNLEDLQTDDIQFVISFD